MDTTNKADLNDPDPKIPGKQEPVTNADEDASSEITDEELAILDATEEGEEDGELHAATLNNTDDDGDELNETVDASGEDLDVPGSEDDDFNEAIGEEDEENNSYSQNADREEGNDLYE